MTILTDKYQINVSIQLGLFLGKLITFAFRKRGWSALIMNVKDEKNFCFSIIDDVGNACVESTDACPK